MRKSKNIIRSKEHYMTTYHTPDKDYDYFWLDFFQFTDEINFRGIGSIVLTKEQEKSARHTFRICFASPQGIDLLMDVLIEMKNKKFNEVAKIFLGSAAISEKEKGLFVDADFCGEEKKNEL